MIDTKLKQHIYGQAVQQIHSYLLGLLDAEDLGTMLVRNVGDFTNRHGVIFQKISVLFFP
jgi:hypothetical protein